MDWPHPPKRESQHHQTLPGMEPTRPMKEGETSKHMEEDSGSWAQTNPYVMEWGKADTEPYGNR